MNEAEKKLFAELMIELIYFGVSRKNHNRIFSPSEHTDSAGEHSAYAVANSGVAERLGPFEKHPHSQKYKITRSINECRVFFENHEPDDEYRLEKVLALYHDTTGYLRENPISSSSYPFDIEDRDKTIMNLSAECGYATALPDGKFQWTDKMAKVFFDNGDWGQSTIKSRRDLV